MIRAGFTLGCVSISALAMLVAHVSWAKSDSSLQTVPSVDLKRYVGRWYEIARYPNKFQKECAGYTTAQYSLREDGKISVLNSCRKSDGETKQSKGTAKIVDKATNSKLKVTFFWPFYGDYWIIDLGKDYEYAVVSEPERKYLWILSRTSTMPVDKYDQILRHLRTQGFDTARLIKTPQ